MALTKQNLAIPFSTSLDLKTDPLQVMPTKFLSLVNAVYTKDKRIQKRNGYQKLTQISGAIGLATFKTNLTAFGSTVQAYDAQSMTFINKGRYQPVKLAVQPTVRSGASQTTTDTAVSPNGLALTAFTDSTGTYYQITSTLTEQILVNATLLPTGAKYSRVFVLGNYFIITFLITISATPHLQYIAIPIANITNPGSAVDISNTVHSDTTGYDGFVANSTLYVAWNGSAGGGAVQLNQLTSNLALGSVVTVASQVADLLSLTCDITGTLPVVWVSYYSTSGTHLKAFAYNASLQTQILAPTAISSTGTRISLASTAQNSVLTSFSQVSNTYTTIGTRSDFLQSFTVTITGTVAGPTVVVRSLGLASKAFLYKGVSYMLGAFKSNYQPTYFLVDGSGNCVLRLANDNAVAYDTTPVLAGAWLNGSVVNIGYLFQTLLLGVAKGFNPTSPSADVNNIYAQAGCNLAQIDLGTVKFTSVEIGNNLHMSGGFLWMYDGAQAVEHNFHLWPDPFNIAYSTTGGSIVAQPDGATNTNAYFYQITYEWTDAQGNIHRSAPSVPQPMTTSGALSTGSAILTIPTLRVTYKKNVRIVVYRWSVANQVFHFDGSITNPLLNDPTVDVVTFTDTAADADIIGNPDIYTTGGVVENIAAPACTAIGLFKSRLILIDDEDPDSLWYSKQVIEATPVENSDLFTEFIAPTTGVEGSTGSTKSISAMDDKLILFKTNAAYYIVGNGPDNTGANNDFSDPIYIASTVGCSNQNSIALIPQGLMFQSNKGIWLLGRGLETNYIGAPVEDFNNASVLTAIVPPGTNQVRFCLDNQQALLYDYYFDRWASFDNLSSISNVVYSDLHTYLDPFGNIFQETPNLYLDGSSPVLMSFTTAWLNLAGLQGFQRAYQVYLLGEYISPHTLDVTISYDYANGPTQSLTLSPQSFAGYWGTTNPITGQGAFWGDSTVWGGSPTLEQYRMFLSTQKMQSMQISVQEVYDASQGVQAGAGLTISGLNAVVAYKKGYVPLPAAQSVG